MKTILAATLVVCSTQAATHELARGQTVILGTYFWDVEANTQQRSETTDVFWQQVRPGVQNLEPRYPAGLAIVTDVPFEKISRDYLKTLKYSVTPIPNTSLKPGTVLGLRTTEGNFAKLKVVGYRSSHDFSFESAKLIPPERQADMRARPIVESRHLEVSWVLYEK